MLNKKVDVKFVKYDLSPETKNMMFPFIDCEKVTNIY